MRSMLYFVVFCLVVAAGVHFAHAADVVVIVNEHGHHRPAHSRAYYAHQAYLRDLREERYERRARREARWERYQVARNHSDRVVVIDRRSRRNLDEVAFRDRDYIGGQCKPALTGVGIQRYGLARAKLSALKAWGREVELTYSRNYVSPERSRDGHYSCDRVCVDCLQWQCKYRATPCRGEL